MSAQLLKTGPCLSALALEEGLKPDFDIVVPDRGAPVSRADLAAFKAKVDALAPRATAHEVTGAAEPADR